MLAAIDAAPIGDSVAFSLLALAIALLSCFVFAGTETAITAMGEHKIKKLLEGGHGPDGFLKLWLVDPSSLLTTLLTGNTLASVAASSVATSLTLSLALKYGLDHSTTDWAVAGAVAVLGSTILIAGEIAPKTIAKHHPEWFLQLMHIVWWFHRTTRWFSKGTTWLAMRIVQMLGGPAQPPSHEVTEEQIEDLVRHGAESGALEKSEGDMLQGVFKLSDTAINTIMTPRTKMAALRIDFTREEVLTEVRSSRWSRYPVYSGTPDKIVGVFFAKDLFDPKIGFDPLGKPKLFRLGDHLHEPMFLPGTVKAIEALKAFQKKKIHLAVVHDEHGGTEGIITLEDVLEELVGDIYDEYDDPEQTFEQIEPTAWTLDAATELRELAESFDLDLPDSESTTVGGFVVEQLGRMPENGESMRWNDLTFKVLEADETRVMRVELRCSPARSKTPLGIVATAV